MSWGGFRRKGATAKMGNSPTVCELNHSHASKLESATCQLLQLRMKAGEIKEIQVQDHVYLTRARIGYIPDFKCTLADGSFLFVEAKGYPNNTWPIKKKLWKFYGPGPLHIYVGSYKNPVLDEEIIPIHGDDNG